MSFRKRFGAIVRPDLVTAAARFPTPVAAALLATVLVILRTEGIIPRGSELVDRALFGTATAFALGTAGRIWLEARGRAAALALAQLGAIAIGAGTASALFGLWLTPGMLLAALVLLVVSAPGLARGGTPVRFWTFNIRSAFAALVGVIGAGAFSLGIWAILATLRSLFDLPVPFRLASHAATIGFVLVLPLYWLAFQPRVLQIGAEEPSPDVLLRAIAALTDFVFIPLLAVYIVILHVYGVKIAIDGVLPRGQIGWMVSIFLGLGYAAFILALPRHSPLPALRNAFRLAWPPSTIVPVGLLALALRQRVQAYGITDDRYLLALVAVGAALLFLAWLPRRRTDVRLVPAVFAALLLVGAVGPLAARNMTVRSQAERFVAVLDASGYLTDGRFNGKQSTPWGQETRRDLQSIIALLEGRRALHLIAPVVGAEQAPLRGQIQARLGLDPAAPTPIVAPYVRIDSDLLLGHFHMTGPSTRSVVFKAPGSAEYTLAAEGRRLVLSGPEGPFAFDLSAEIAQVPGPEPNRTRLVRADDRRAVLILRHLRWEGSGEARALGSLSGEILIRHAVP